MSVIMISRLMINTQSSKPQTEWSQVTDVAGASIGIDFTVVGPLHTVILPEPEEGVTTV